MRHPKRRHLEWRRSAPAVAAKAVAADEFALRVVAPPHFPHVWRPNLRAHSRGDQLEQALVRWFSVEPPAVRPRGTAASETRALAAHKTTSHAVGALRRGQCQSSAWLVRKIGTWNGEGALKGEDFDDEHGSGTWKHRFRRHLAEVVPSPIPAPHQSPAAHRMAGRRIAKETAVVAGKQAGVVAAEKHSKKMRARSPIPKDKGSKKKKRGRRSRSTRQGHHRCRKRPARRNARGRRPHPAPQLRRQRNRRRPRGRRHREHRALR